MIGTIMYVGLGFLVALVILPLAHARAVRLTARRLEAGFPVSVAEIKADKDQLRAESRAKRILRQAASNGRP